MASVVGADALDGSGSRAFLKDGGELGALISARDWSATPLGPIETWPQSLKTVTGMLLRSPVPIVLLWGEKGIMIYNDAYSVFAGGRHPQLLGSEVRKGWPEVAEFNDNVMKVGLANGTLSYTDQELTLYRRGVPEQVWMNLDYSPVYDERGQPAGVIAIVVETTERVQATARLREAERRLRFLDTLGKATAVLQDADAILATTTRMVGEHLGISICAYADMDADEDGFTIRGDWSAPGSPSIVGHYSLKDFGALAVRNLSAGRPLVINDNRTEIAPHEAATFQSIGITATICCSLVKAGRLTALMAIHDKNPRTWTAYELALITEVTARSWAHIERVRSEAEARAADRRFREELEAQVEQRTAELERSQKTLQQIQKMEALGQLTGGVAHDFNNLLMAVVGSLELLRKRVPQDAKLLRLVDNAMEGALRGSALTKRMLAFARQQELKSERIDVADLVDGMMELMTRSLGPTIELKIDVPRGISAVEADANQLETALLNLAVNARDAMRGEGVIAITGREQDFSGGEGGLRPGRYVCLAVTDTGQGMDDATLKKAVDPFFTTKEVGKGTGLGLSMVHGFTEQSGGCLMLKSAPGKGTTAEICLPAREVRSSPSAQPRLALKGGAQHHEGVSVLVVDDDALVLMGTVDMLEDMGCRVASAASGRAALELLANRSFDVVITDHAMPQMTGAQLATEILRNNPKQRIVLATGYADLPASSPLQLPRLPKPFSQSDLSDAITKTLRG